MSFIRKYLSVFLLFLAVALLPAKAQSPTFIDALRASQEGRAAEAVSLFEKELEQSPDNDAAYMYLAVNLMALDNPDYDRIESLLHRAVELSPDNYWYTYTLANFYAFKDEPEMCAKLYEELLGKNPGKRALYFDLANTYMVLGDLDKALEAMDRIEDRIGKNELICLTKMDLLIRKHNGDRTEAYKMLEEYYKDVQTPRLATMLGDYCQENYLDQKAIDYYSQAIAMDSDYQLAYYGRANTYRELRQYEPYFSDLIHFMADGNLDPKPKAEYLAYISDNPQFMTAFRPEMDSLAIALLQAHPGDTTIHTGVGIYYHRTERPYLAIELMRQNTVNYPDSYTLGFEYLLLLYYNNAYDAAIDEATRLFRAFSENTDPLLVRANIFARKGENRSAIEDYELIASRAPKDSATIMSVYPSMGDLYHQEGQTKKAYKCYEKVLKIDPDHTLTLNNYAYFLSLEGKNLRKAKEMSRKTILAEPDNPTYLDTYAWILHLMGDDPEAKLHFKHAMLYGGKENAVILDHYADVLYALGEYDLAFIYWEQAAALDNTLGIEEKIKARKAERK